MRNITLKSLHNRIETKHFPHELIPVAQSFNIMLNELQKSFEQISRFSIDIAHELRTPLNSLMIKIDVTLGKSRTIAEYQDLLESLSRDARGLSKLIDALLFLGRAENPNREIQLENFEVSQEINSLIDLYEPMASEKSITITFKSQGPIRFDMEKSLFARALGNLIHNSIQYCPSHAEITIGLFHDDRSLRIEVADNGPGIEHHHLAFLFDRLYRVDPSRNKNSGGLGLGLSIVLSIMKLHGGTVSADSDVGKGSIFTLYFPNRNKLDETRIFKNQN